MSKSKTTSINSYVKKNGEKCYMFKLYVGIDSLTGKEQYTTRRGFKTKKEAELALARIKLEISNGIFRKQQADTYQEIYDLWITQYKKEVTESTFVKTIGIFRNHILPAMGKYRITKINYDICEKHVNEWADKLKNVSIVKSYASKVLNHAIKKDYIQTNPFALVNIPSGQKTDQYDDENGEIPENFYTKEQLIHFLQCMKQVSPTKAYTLFHLLAYSGMRKGEALALTWSDVNFSKNEIRINKALSRGDSRLYTKSTKNKVARTIKMDTTTMGILKEWEKKQSKHLQVTGFNTRQQKQLIFSNTKNEYLQLTVTNKWLESVLKKCQLPKKITTHGFRHTHCSLLYEAGIGLKETQHRLGHKNIKTTMNIYAHLSDRAKGDAVNKFEIYMAI